MGLIAQLEPADVGKPGFTTDGWSVKDLIAHIGAWLAEAGLVFEQLNNGTYAEQDYDVEEMDQRFFQANAGLPLSIVRAECAASRNRMLSEWNALTSIEPAAEEWFREAGPDHYAEHLAQLREWAERTRTP